MEQNPNFCTGVQILISRMESNPEEFTKGDKWYWIMSKVVDAKRNPTHHANTLPELTTEEINALFDAYTPFLRKKFDDSVLREVLSSEEKELSSSVTTAPPTVLGNSTGSSLTTNAGAGSAITWAAYPVVNSLSIGNASLNEEEIKTIKRRVL